MNETYIKNVIEAALLAAGRPLQVTELAALFDENVRPTVEAMRAALQSLEADYSSRGIEVKETANGFRIQVRREMANEVSRLWPERPPRYSRALLETLALIAYRQPITRAEIEAVRGVAVNPNIIKTILERNWVRVVGTRDVPGRPELLGTTKEFLDYFGLRSLEDLPPLSELKAMGDINLQLDLTKPDVTGEAGGAGEAARTDAQSTQTTAGTEATGDAEGTGSPEAQGAAASDAAAAEGEGSSNDGRAAADAAVAAGVAVGAAALDAVASADDELVEPAPREGAATADSPGEIELADVTPDSLADDPEFIEVGLESDDADVASLDEESSDEEEDELSAGPQSSTELVAAPRDRDD